MLRKAILSLVVMATLLVGSVGNASANHHHGGYRGGYGHPHYYGGYGGYGYRGFAPRVIVPPPVYAYPPMVGYGYGVQPGYGPVYGYGAPGFSVNTPGFGLYVR